MKRALLGAATALAVLFALPALASAAPTARYTYTPSDPYTGESVRFDASSSTCDATPCQYRYRDLGPDNSRADPNWTLRGYSTNPVLAFTFKYASTKNVELSVRNARGEYSRTKKAIAIKQGPRPAGGGDATDTDGDGVPDSSDQCPTQDGPVSNDGCPATTPPPPTDTDGDGVPDSSDQCPAQDGPASNNGCPATTPPPAGGGFPSPASTGLPAGWTPAQTRTTDLVVTTPGAVVQDVRLDNADLLVLAPNVTVRRVNIRGGRLLNAQGNDCAGQGMVVEDSTIEPPPGQALPVSEPYVVGEGGYTLRRVKIWNVGDGPRVSYKPEGCGPVTIEDTFIKVTQAGHSVWHTDGLQAWYGNHLNIRNSTIDARGDSLGTSAAFFYPNQNNTSATVDNLLVAGGAYSFRLGEPGTVSGLKVANNSWIYGPLDSKCSVITSWEAKIVNVDWNTYQPTSTVRDLPCDTNGGD
jgi:hypothetical protein